MATSDSFTAIFTQGLPWACLVILAWLHLWCPLSHTRLDHTDLYCAAMAVSVYLYYSPKAIHWSARMFKPMWLNIGAVLFLPIQLATTIAIFGVSARRADDAFTGYEEFRAQMAELGASWSYGQPFVLVVRLSTFLAGVC